jgi:tRNA A37 threonylcarbamoyladenosine dehydratase
VYSDEQVISPNSLCEVENYYESTYEIIDDTLEANIHKFSEDVKNTRAITGLNCAGYGSSVCVTASFGFTIAQLAILQVVQTK